ncbi:replicative DNA helicase [Streptosporangium sp. NPDC050855]|uniref:replicative DNA helicase n=1 Tax=Streptosporangium sp. NPDC050855 TaxID=3366194 RepID=UPI003789F3A4
MNARQVFPDSGAEQVSDPQAPRNDVLAEQSVLGSIMLAPKALDDVLGLIRSADFYRPSHQTIYETILDLSRRGEPYDPVTVVAALADKKLLDRVGGASYLHTLTSVVPTVANATYYAKIVHKLAKVRSLVTAGTSLVRMGMDGDPDLIDDYLSTAHALLVSHHENGADPPTFDEAVLEFLDELENGAAQTARIPAPYKDLDALLDGFHAGQLIVIGARPSVGKSVVATDIAREAAIKHGAPVFFASLEMSRMEMVKRIVSAEARVPMHLLRKDRMTEGDWAKVVRMVERTSGAPLIIDQSPNVTLTSIRASLRRMQHRTDVAAARMLVVDYLQLLTTTSRAENRQVQVSELSRGLKLIAKEFEIPVVMLSQLNRNPEQRQDKRPAVSDLRESGALEQDADVVLLLHREDVHDKETPRAGEMDIIVGKNRNGPTATISAAFQGHYASVVDMAPD